MLHTLYLDFYHKLAKVIGKKRARRRVQFMMDQYDVVRRHAPLYSSYQYWQ